jgi:hypothetical protein
MPRLLKEFRLTLPAHLRLEDVQFYGYLQQENAAATPLDSRVARRDHRVATRAARPEPGLPAVHRLSDSIR